VIRVDGVSVSFDDLTVLDGVDCHVERGEFVGLVGPNGAGKTTLLRTINGLLTPDSGRVTLNGDPVRSLPSKEVSRRVATVPQDTHVGFSFTAEHLVEMGRTPHRSRLDWSEADDPVEAAMDRTETTHLRNRPVDGLSGGERQRVLLARALAQETPALLLDEPTASLDINHQIRVLDIVSSLVADGRTALAAIHDLDLAARYCDRLLLLHDGAIKAAGRPEDVLADPAVEEAFGTRTAVARNPATGTATVTAIDGADAELAQVHVVGGGEPAARVLSALWRDGYKVTLGVVPEGDTAAETADRLGVRAVTAAPFSSPSGEVLGRARSLVDRADVVVSAGRSGVDSLDSAVAASDRVVDVTDAGVQPSEVSQAVETALARRGATADD
jgi:iron complex transport system ATP-binding protein